MLGADALAGSSTEPASVNAAAAVVGKSIEPAQTYASSESTFAASTSDDDDDESLSYFAKLAQGG